MQVMNRLTYARGELEGDWSTIAHFDVEMVDVDRVLLHVLVEMAVVTELMRNSAQCVDAPL